MFRDGHNAVAVFAYKGKRAEWENAGDGAREMLVNFRLLMQGTTKQQASMVGSMVDS